ncbi:FUSC family protein [Microbacterium sp. A82]|uniref:FUSC family protein n=1 Tax=Microbacterium sp. A82 TaxID=3450452 RepID=UPI003F3210A5
MATEARHSPWVRALVRVTPARIQWERVGLAAVGVTVPVGLSLLIDPRDATVIGAGALASMGALVGSVMDTGAAGAERVRRITLVTAAASIGFALGVLVYGHSVFTLVAVILATLISALSGAIGPVASKAGLYFLVYAVTAANADFGLDPAWQAPLIFLAGGLWRLCLTAVSAALIGVRLSPERRAIAQVYTALAAQLAAQSEAAASTAGLKLTNALDDAYDTLVASRTNITERDIRWQELVTILNASAPAVDAAIAVAAKQVVAPKETITYLRGVAAWIADARHPLPELPVTHSAGAEVVALRMALERVDRAVAQFSAAGSGRAEQLVAPDLPARQTFADLVHRVERPLSAGAETWRFAGRLVLCMAIAQGVSIALHLDRPYLVMLAVAQAMKPDFGSIFARAVQRGFGTMIGVAIAALTISLVPHGGWQILVILPLAALIPIAMPRNFGLFSAIMTSLAVLLVELHAGASAGLVSSRLMDTVLGCAIVLLIGYLPWPATWRAPRNLAKNVAGLARSIAQYAGIALEDQVTDSDAQRAAAARRALYRQIADMRTLVARSLSEPRIADAASAWMLEIAALERVTDAITAAATTQIASSTTVDRQATERAQAALRELADAIEAGRAPQTVEPSGSGPLALMDDEISSARAAASAWSTRNARSRKRVHLRREAGTEQ